MFQGNKEKMVQMRKKMPTESCGAMLRPKQRFLGPTFGTKHYLTTPTWRYWTMYVHRRETVSLERDACRGCFSILFFCNYCFFCFLSCLGNFSRYVCQHLETSASLVATSILFFINILIKEFSEKFFFILFVFLFWMFIFLIFLEFEVHGLLSDIYS